MSLEQAALRSAGLIAATVVGVILGNKLLALVGAKMDVVNERMRRSNGLDLLMGTALASVHRPALVLLPWYGFFYILLIASAFADVAVLRLDAQVHTVTHLCAAQVLEFLNHTSQLMQDTSELVLIIFAAWFLISWKEHLVRTVVSKMEDSGMSDEPNLVRVLVPIGNLLSWAIVAGAVLTTLTAFGVNVQPLLTFGSIGTVAVGLAAQSTMQNVVSALQIYSSRPFIVGDRIQLKSLSGSVIVSGVVEHIAPMRTVVRGDNKLPVYVNNKDVMNLIVVNESKLRRDNVLPKLPLITASLTVRYKDVDKLAQIEKSITGYLAAHPDVDAAISARCVLAEFTAAGPQLALRALLHRRAASRQSLVLSEMLQGAEQIVRGHGAFLAMQYPMQLPPSPPPQPWPAVSRALDDSDVSPTIAGQSTYSSSNDWP
ncbi:hypothetical protein D9Q98_003035 [Chlorella vulgaris]|uniref:Mechanosensitive ion channel MscS domain-containing protein n=1 Tax=Chlorella vulgaris TaxID=3077 RepID=A0A9D4TV12_CHLVU|nr:hypothetical protein D9Q98_003035 [Chlorella vulgaris]